MSPPAREELEGTQRATVILTACIVEAMRIGDPAFKDRFVEALDRAYQIRKESPASLAEVKMLSLAREITTGFSVVAGQGKPFFDE